MDPTPLNDLIDSWTAAAKSGELGWSELAERILQMEQTSLQTDAQDTPDLDRKRRCGFGEVIFGSGKSAESVQQIASRLLDAGQADVLVTRCDLSLAEQIQPHFANTYYNRVASILRIARSKIVPVNADYQTTPSGDPLSLGRVAVISAGSTDAAVAQEAHETLRWMGVEAELICDVGVAGPYRLLAHLDSLRSMSCLVVVAGMEGALASVVGGLVECPIIAVPTSVGYGANLEGITTLLSMMSSCAAGVTVVNIDAGFKGGYIAGLIAHQVAKSASAK